MKKCFDIIYGWPTDCATISLQYTYKILFCNLFTLNHSVWQVLLKNLA